jgi:hypothetical protein
MIPVARIADSVRWPDIIFNISWLKSWRWFGTLPVIAMISNYRRHVA